MFSKLRKQEDYWMTRVCIGRTDDEFMLIMFFPPSHLMRETRSKRFYKQNIANVKHIVMYVFPLNNSNNAYIYIKIRNLSLSLIYLTTFN